MIRNYIKIALRNLVKNRVYSVINILGLSVGIAACMLIFLYAKDDLSFDHFHKNKENMYRLTVDMTKPSGEQSHFGSTGMMPGPAFARYIPEVESFVRLQSDNVTVKNAQGAFAQEALWADANLFTFFTFPLLYGNAATALSDLHAVVISEDLAKKYFGRSDVMGQPLQVTTGFTQQTFVVSGVVKDPPQNSSLRPQLVLPMKNKELRNKDTQWVNFYLNTFVQLRPGTDLQKFEQRMNEVYNREAADNIREMEKLYQFRDKIRYHAQPLLAMHLSKELPADNGLTSPGNANASLILSGIAIFLLIIASINFINLTVARSIKRAREIGVRKVVGSSQRQLVAQFLGESFVLSFFSFALACCLTWLALPFFNRLAGKALSFSYLLDAQLMAGYFLLFLVTGLLAGFYPALVLSRFRPVETLYGRVRLGGKNYLSRGLLVFQFALSAFLVIATITLYRQLNYLVNFDLGYDRHNVLSVELNMQKSDELKVFRQELLKHPAIEKVSGDQGGNWQTIANINGGKEMEFNMKLIDADYFPLFTIPVVKGRNFSANLVADSAEAVMVNETFVKNAGWADPLGQVVDFFYMNKKFRVIGVVRDYHYLDLNQKIGAQLFTMNPRYRYGKQYLKLREGSITEGLAHLERTAKSMYPGQPFAYTFEDDAIAGNYEKEARWKQIVGFSAVLTIFISCIGLFGLSVLNVEKRAREISIRKVLGASVRSIAGKLSADYLKLVAIATALALPAGWWCMSLWLQDYPYHTPLSWLIFGGTVVLIVLLALATVGIQAIRAALANPVKHLRAE